MAKNIKCKYEKSTCFAMYTGYCLALAEMPNSDKCPFYKKEEETDAITKQLIKEAKDRMKRK